MRNNEDVSDYWKNNGEVIHYIGKDIIYFHFLFWPALLMCTDFNLPKQIKVHGFLTINNEKMSKSRGTFITARQYLNHLPPELLRFYFASNLTSRLIDIDLDLNDFKEKINHELIANIGNFSYRTISFVNNNFKSKLSTIGNEFNEHKIREEIEQKLKIIEKYFEEGEYREAVKEILAISTLGNKYFQEAQPWKLIKEDEKKAQQVMTFACNILKNLSIVLFPIMPETCKRLQHQLQCTKTTWQDLDFSLHDHTISKGEPLFKKLENEADALIPKKLPFEIRIAQIISVNPHPNADRLYHLRINLGNEERELVAGLKDHYTAEQLMHKKVLVLCNLIPAEIRGIKSQGMVLVTAKGKKIKLIEPQKSNLGELVYTDHKDNIFTLIDYNEFKKIKIVTKQNHIYFEDKKLKTDSEILAHEFEDNGIVQ